MEDEGAVSERDRILRLPEDPPGLERVRRWLAGPWRWLRPVWLWVRWLAVGFVIGCREAGRIAARGARVARAGSAVARRVGAVGGRVERMGSDWSRAGGRLGRFGERLARTGKGLRGRGARWSGLGSDAARLGEAVAELGEEIEDAVAGATDETESSGGVIGLGLGRARLPRGEASAGGGPVARRAADGGKPSGESEPQPVPVLAAEPAVEAPAEPVRPPAAAPRPASPPATAPAPRPRPTRVPAARGEPPPPAARKPPRAPAPRPELPDDFPFPLQAEIRALGERPRREHLRRVIEAVLANRGWTRPAKLAAWLGVNAEGLSRRHLGPMVAAGRLERRYPGRPNHRAQAYRTVPAEGSPPAA